MKYSAKPEHASPHYNRHWYRHILVAFSPGGILPLPFQVWLWFPDEILITCYHIGMVPDMLLSSCSPDWGHAERFATDLARFEAQWGHRLVDRKSFSRVKASLFGLLRVVVQGESWQSPLRVFSRNASLGLGFHGSSLFFLVEEAVQLWLISAKVRRNMLFAFSLALSISSAAVSSPGSDGT